MGGWVDLRLGVLITSRPGVEPTTARSKVQRPITAAPARHPCMIFRMSFPCPIRSVSIERSWESFFSFDHSGGYPAPFCLTCDNSRWVYSHSHVSEPYTLYTLGFYHSTTDIVRKCKCTWGLFGPSWLGPTSFRLTCPAGPNWPALSVFLSAALPDQAQRYTVPAM